MGCLIIRQKKARRSADGKKEGNIREPEGWEEGGEAQEGGESCTLNSWFPLLHIRNRHNAVKQHCPIENKF